MGSCEIEECCHTLKSETEVEVKIYVRNFTSKSFRVNVPQIVKVKGVFKIINIVVTF